MKIVPLIDFGKDHWSVFAYAETCCVDNGGIMEKRRLRCNINTHPIHCVNANIGVGLEWNPEWGTRLKGFWINKKCFKDGFQGDRTCPERQLPDHDEWDCLNDLEAAGLLEVISEANAEVEITELGSRFASALRTHKANGGMFANFDPGEIK